MESEYYQVKIDDPDRDSRLIENNLMRELCEKGFLCSKEWSAFRVYLEDIWNSSLAVFEISFVQRIIRDFQENDCLS